MDNKLRPYLHWLNLWLTWNIYTDISLVILGGLGFIAYALFYHGGDLVIVFIVPLSWIVGVFQWIAIRSKVSRSGWWILATAMGWSVCVILFFTYLGFISIDIAFLVGAAAGALIGLPQWLVLRKTPGAIWWVLASVVGWAWALFAAMILSNSSLGPIGVVVVSLSVMSMITGVAYVYLFADSGQKRLSTYAVAGLVLGFALIAWLVNARMFGQLKFTLRGNGAVYTVDYSPIENMVASGSGDSTVELWDATNGRLIRTLGERAGDFHLAVKSIAFSPDGKYLAAGFYNGTVKLWDPATGEELKSWQAPATSLETESITFSPDGRLLGVLGDRELLLWDIVNEQEVRSMRISSRLSDGGMAFSPNGKFLAAGESDFASLWDVNAGYELLKINPNVWIESVAFSPDGKLLATGGFVYSDSEQAGGLALALWDVATGEKIKMLGGAGENVNSLDFSPDGSLLAAGCTDGIIILWEVATGQKAATLTGHAEGVNSVRFSPDGRFLVSGSYDGTTRIWKVPEY